MSTNLFGDILSDEMAGLVGGLGVAPSANIGEHAAIFEAAHGCAPDIEGKGVANPVSLLLAAELMLKHVGKHGSADRLRAAINTTVNRDVIRTPDLGGRASTREFAEAVARRCD
jgi:isocitrate dehydrogenase (NAD+)